MLDDIFDKLDDNRVKRMLELIMSDFFGQIFITDTHEDRVREIFEKYEIDFKKFKITDGKIELN